MKRLVQKNFFTRLVREIRCPYQKKLGKPRSAGAGEGTTKHLGRVGTRKRGREKNPASKGTAKGRKERKKKKLKIKKKKAPKAVSHLEAQGRGVALAKTSSRTGKFLQRERNRDGLKKKRE